MAASSSRMVIFFPFGVGPKYRSIILFLRADGWLLRSRFIASSYRRSEHHRPIEKRYHQPSLLVQLRSREGVSIPGDELLDRHRLAATDFSDVVVGAGKDAVTVIDRNLLQMLHDKRLSRIGAGCTGIIIKGRRGVPTRLIRIAEAKFRVL